MNAETLNALKTSLDDLKIVDVKHKPQGLSENLKAGEDFMNNREALQDLIIEGVRGHGHARGRIARDYFQRWRSRRHDEERRGVRAAVRQSHGNRRQRRTSKIKRRRRTTNPATRRADDEKKDDKSDVHRYLFVMARFNKDAVQAAGTGEAARFAGQGRCQGRCGCAAAEGDASRCGKEGEAAADAKAETPTTAR